MVTSKSKAKRVPPSRLRYESRNPVVSVRISQETKRQLDLLKFESGMSAADVLRIGLDRAKPDIKVAYERGVEDGVETGREIYEVPYACGECGEWHLSISSDEEKVAASEFMTQQGWHDPRCR